LKEKSKEWFSPGHFINKLHPGLPIRNSGKEIEAMKVDQLETSGITFLWRWLSTLYVLIPLRNSFNGLIHLKSAQMHLDRFLATLTKLYLMWLANHQGDLRSRACEVQEAA
jgi:hypothetical protein